ncbi:MAG TPA: CRISPR-associated protein Cas4 [Pirellulales bacterium]|nr:CRISPR-associated protein Cas4 [Pirellulales bacterium]
MDDEDDYQPIRALNDLLFCERRCAMHRVEQVWIENRFTLEGTTAHKKVHSGPSQEELGTYGRTVRGLWVRSDRLKLVGIADLVEFRKRDCRPDGPSATEPKAAGLDGGRARPTKNEAGPNASRPHCGPFPQGEGIVKETPYPVEYKRGRRRRWDNDDVQLCAQALCLEEMLGVPVPAGAIFHVKSRRRREIVFDNRLRERTEAAARRLHELFDSAEIPLPVLKPRCRGCSLHDLCLPELLSERSRASRYLRSLFEAPMSNE